jgi:GNAT superfamily N-acetyltransferase
MDVIEMTEELQITRLEDWDLTEALRLSTQAGWNQTAEDWQRVLTLTRTRGRFAGRINGQLVATGTLIEHGNKCGWVGMILVDESYRKRGYGTAMLDRTIAAADDARLRWIGLDATDMGRPLYLKRGFQDVGHKDRWRITKRPRVLKLDRMEKLGLPESAWELDFKATGIDRTAMFMAMYTNPEIEGYRLENGTDVTGFGLSRPGRIGAYIGPVIAQTTETAAGIVSKLLERFTPTIDTPVFIDVPRGSSIEPWLKSEGFEVVRSWTRMIRGEPWIEQSEMVFAIAGPELG